MMINYYKGEPNTYTICSRNGKVLRRIRRKVFFGCDLLYEYAAG